jgi:Probable Zinc-ribbon domain
VCKSTGCGHKNKLPNGKKSLAETHPEIAKQAHGWDPRTVTAGCNQKRQFRCKLGHLPSPVPVNKQISRGAESCAICSGKQVVVGVNDLATIHPEIAAQAYGWDPRTVTAGSGLKKQFRCKLGHLPKPQPVCNKVAYGPSSCGICAGKETLVGFNDLLTTHPEIAAQAHGWDPRTVTAGSAKKFRFRCNAGHISEPKPVQNKVAYGLNSCAVCAGQIVFAGVNDLATTHPEIAAQAYGWDPKTVTAGSKQKRQFRCRLGHLPKPQRIFNRVNLGVNSCAICKGQELLTGYNDMATTNPELSAQYLGDPTKVIAGTDHRLGWRCEKGHTWKAVGSSRIAGRGCPTCSRTGYDPSKRGVFYLIHRHGQFKLGITNIGNNRIYRHSLNGWILIDKIEAEGESIAAFERSAKKSLKALGIPTGPAAFREPFDGFTEAWNAVDLSVRSIRGLCRKLGVSLAV